VHDAHRGAAVAFDHRVDRRLQLCECELAHALQFAGQALEFVVVALDDVVLRGGSRLHVAGPGLSQRFSIV